MKSTFKITSDMLRRRISDQDRRNAIKRTELLNYLGIIEYYDQPNTVYTDEYIPTGYSNMEEYETDKFNAKMLIDVNKPIPKELENRLVAARKELEQHGVLEPIE